MTVSINIKPEALEIIKKKMDPDHQVVLLALNDGSNNYSKQGGTCTIGANFQFVILEKEDPAYNIKIENNAGLNLSTSEAELVLEDGLVVNARNASMSLSDNSGIIDGAVTVDQFTPSDVTKSDLLNGKTC